MFNDQMGLTRAVLDGDKTMTRRLEYVSAKSGVLACDIVGSVSEEQIDKEMTIKNARYKVGEVIAIAQCYGDCGTWLFPTAEYGDMAGYTNKMFVKADLMPHQIRITNVKVERLQDISDEDILKEGVSKVDFALKDRGSYSFKYKHKWYKQYHTAREAFAALIDKVSGNGVWVHNPWVIAYEFELVK